MPRHDGATRRRESRRKNAGHRMHRRTRLARLRLKPGSGRSGNAWGRGGLS